MPLYEYICPDDGHVIELLRSMKDADAPVEDPEGKGRAFVRKHSVFGVSGGAPSATTSGHVHTGGCCPCGKPQTQCGRN
jgi:putative FmdB family regulatory protein